MVMDDLPQPRQTFMLDKGLYDKPGEVVTAAVPAKLPPLPAGAPPNRLGLAQWLVVAGPPADRPRHGQPLLAAVLRHRAW